LSLFHVGDDIFSELTDVLDADQISLSRGLRSDCLVATVLVIRSLEFTSLAV